MQILDAPVPQPVENVKDTLRILDHPIAEQVIEVPKIYCSPCPSRSVVPVPQSAEQLVEVPTIISFSSFQQTSMQNVDISLHVFPQNRVQLLLMFFWNSFPSGLWSRSVLVEIFLRVVQVLVSFSRDRVQLLLVASKSPTLLLLEVLTVFSQGRFQRRLLELITFGMHLRVGPVP